MTPHTENLSKVFQVSPFSVLAPYYESCETQVDLEASLTSECEPHPLAVKVFPFLVEDKNCRLTILSLTKRESDTLDWKANSMSDIKCSSKSCEKTRVKEIQDIRKHNHHMLDGGSRKSTLYHRR